MNLNYVGEITDPIHRNIRFTEIEREILDTSIFQRLRRIRQLAGAHLVYPSAQHSRFEHSLGAMHLAGIAGNVLLSKNYIQVEDIQKLRLAALLHDVGHGPFSHLSEELFERKKKLGHENIGKDIIQKTEIGDLLQKSGYDSKEISNLSFGNYQQVFFCELISGPLSVDIMDYLPRDAFFTGSEYGKIDYYRLINSFEVLSNGHLAIDKSAINSFESMILSRYEMFKAVYFHKTVRSGEVMMLNAMIMADEQLHFTDSNLDEYLGLTDEHTIDLICSIKENHRASKLAIDYKNRRLLKCVFEKIFHNKNRSKKEINVNDFKKYLRKLNVDTNSIFLDISTAPSMPLTPSKREINSVFLVNKEKEYETPISELPVIRSLTGFLDMLRVYAVPEIRTDIETTIDNLENKQWI